MRETATRDTKIENWTVHQRKMAPMGDVLHLLVILSLLETGNAKVGDFKAAGATAPGDIIIGGLFPIHEGVEESPNISAPHEPQCARYSKCQNKIGCCK